MAPDAAQLHARKKVRGRGEVSAIPDDSNTQDEESHLPAGPGGTKETAPKSLEVIFNNRILLSSFLTNFPREDYTFFAELAASIPGVLHEWPDWNPLRQPWPQGQLPFEVRSLSVKCQNERSPLRRVVVDASAEEGTHPEYSNCVWEFTEDPLNRKKCDLSSKDLGVRLKAGCNPGHIREKEPIELLECAGHRIFAVDTSFGHCDYQLHTPGWLDDGEEPPRTPWDHVKTLAQMHGKHGAGFIVCSPCARQAHVNNSICLWRHERMLPLCHDCSLDPSMHEHPHESYGLRLGVNGPSIAGNIRAFSQGEPYLKCDCHENYSPLNGYHLCTDCSLTLADVLARRFGFIRLQYLFRGNEYTSPVFELDSSLGTYPRSHCPCGKNAFELKTSWAGFTQEEVDRKMYRMCTLCTGHIPRQEIITAKSTNCL
ncbi:hypothetical protein H2200_003258 [Cladophialophora chaetospira]|uniref:Uncharacterized protein n=1 Tax=Cladophialophora chaetospira TaxID=386627 RepID=A0AA38XH79_9EURO|nr:hypothetical protein H2200_003258 [Cladophialophora chaetospira]